MCFLNCHMPCVDILVPMWSAPQKLSNHICKCPGIFLYNLFNWTMCKHCVLKRVGKILPSWSICVSMVPYGCYVILFISCMRRSSSGPGLWLGLNDAFAKFSDIHPTHIKMFLFSIIPQNENGMGSRNPPSCKNVLILHCQYHGAS